MPVFSHQGPAVINHDELVDALASELSGVPVPPPQPQIYEDEIPQTRTLHVLVIWDRWQGVPGSARGPIIYDAYEKFDRTKMLRVKFAFGFTYDEAVAGGYLPYKVESTIRQSDPIDYNEARKQMIALGARQTGSNLELRFPYQRLRTKH